MPSFRTAASLTALAAFVVGRVAAESIPMAYCATINTASTAANYSIYQSDGLCRDFCNNSNNAYAVVKDSNCWCSDYTPATSVQISTDKCNNPCPGFPSDTCGGDGSWGYIKLNVSPKGVKGGDSSSSGSNGGSQTTTKQTSPTNTATNTATTPQTIVSTVTADGTTSQVTITLPPSTNNANQASNGEMATTSSGLSTGAAVGIAVGVLGILGIIIGAAVWFWLRRKKQNQQEAAVERSNSGRGSSAGMMGTPRTEMASIWDSEQLSTGRRNSRLMPHDPRMDPFAGNIYAQANKSRESINTLQDNHDYSRKVLRTTNPDPDQD